MAVIANKRSTMLLYSDPGSAYSHRARYVLAEKSISVEIRDVDPSHLPEDLLELNPYNTVPTLVDRDLVLYESRIIMDYFDERFPHPPLLPVDPVSRAKSRLLLYRIDRDWYSLLADLESGLETESAKARQALRDSLSTTAPIFDIKPYFMSDEFSLVDCSVAPLLWRLPYFGIELPNDAKPLLEYAERIFEREAFHVSLSELEREMRI